MRMSEAEKKAAALPPKLTVPMILFFLPVLFVVILGPAAIRVMATQETPEGAGAEREPIPLNQVPVEGASAPPGRLSFFRSLLLGHHPPQIGDVLRGFVGRQVGPDDLFSFSEAALQPDHQRQILPDLGVRRLLLCGRRKVDSACGRFFDSA